MAKQKTHGVRVSKTGAYAIAQAAGIHRRGGAVKNKKKENSRKACRGRLLGGLTSGLYSVSFSKNFSTHTTERKQQWDFQYSPWTKPGDFP